jgi:hypothetical protein
MDINSGLAWLGFWIFAAVFFAADTWIYSQGHDSFFYTRKTAEEKELLQLQIEQKKLSIKQLKCELDKK